MTQEILSLENVGFQAAGQQILNNINLTVERGKLLPLLVHPVVGKVHY